MPKRKTTAPIENFAEPLMSVIASKKEQAIASEARSAARRERRNASGSITKTDRYTNIEEGISPFIRGSAGTYSSNISTKDSIILCQKAYWNVSIFRNTIDLMTEFSVAPIKFEGGNKESKKFFKAWAKKVDLWSLQDQWYREYYRSGNVFLYKLNATFDAEMKKKFKQAFGEINAEIPIKYLLLNPADLAADGNRVFNDWSYFKILNAFELSALLHPINEHDREIADSIPELKKYKGKKGASQTIAIPLKQERIAAVFYKKQDYEPMAVPMGFPVLEDINTKLEMKKMDAATLRTLQQMVLHISMGDKDLGPAPEKNRLAMQALFGNESVARVLVTDHTTQLKFIVPEIDKIIDPKKYELIDRDIRFGLNNVLFGEEKFASTDVKVEIFLARLQHANEAFINQFLQPEIEKIGRMMKFDQVPQVKVLNKDFKDDVLRARIYTELMRLNVLTPEQGIEAIKNGDLPNEEESIESQKKLLKHREDGLYAPFLGEKVMDGGDGRPTGTGVPKQTNKVSPIGTSKASQTIYSTQKMKDVMLASASLLEKVKESLRVNFNVKRLTNEQISVAEQLSEVIMSSKPMEEWMFHVEHYVKNPSSDNPQMLDEINEIAAKFGLESYPATILYHCRKDFVPKS